MAVTRLVIVLLGMALIGCDGKSQQGPAPPALLLSHDKNGNVLAGDKLNIVNAIRQGCALTVAWGASNLNVDPPRKIEHTATPNWVTVRNDNDIFVQIGGFMINQSVLGEPEEEHPRRAAYGGTTYAVRWEAQLKPDGNFDAVWYYPHSGEFIKRAPQRHAMRWYGSCTPGAGAPLYPAP